MISDHISPPLAPLRFNYSTINTFKYEFLINSYSHHIFTTSKNSFRKGAEEMIETLFQLFQSSLWKTPSPIPQTPPKPRVSLYLSESLPLDLWLHLDLGSMWSKEQCNINVCVWEYLSMCICVFMMYLVYMSKYVRLSEFVLK